MIDRASIERIKGQDVYDPSGSKIGSASGVYLDDTTGVPEWVTVRTGLFGGSESFVPVRDAHLTTDGLQVQVAKDRVKDAPRVDADQHLPPAEERELHLYYGLEYGPPAAPAPTGSGVEPFWVDGDQVAGPLDPPAAQRNVASPPEAKPLLRRYGA
jgi:hypothetical protein